MSLPKYEKYKDSGFEWLGDIPVHWEIQRLSNVCSFKSGKAHEPFIDDDGEFICVNSRFVSTEGESRKFCTENLSPAQRNDILMVMSDLPNGRALAKAFFVSDKGPYAVNQRVCILSDHQANAKFLFYLLNRNPLFLRHDDGVNQTHLSNALFTRFPTLVPPPDEQIAIASFLDSETSKIDGLVAQQRRLIELLREKRQAVISHAVTKGLNPAAPMKPSGIDWMGDVPEHWPITRLSYFATIENGSTPSRNNLDYWDGGTVPWIASGEVNQYKVQKPSELITERALADCPLRLLPTGTVIVGMIGQGKTRGLAAILAIEGAINQNLAAIVPGNRLDSVYLRFVFQSAYIYLREFGRGGQQAALNCEILGAMRIPVPPIGEQIVICGCIDKKLDTLDVLRVEAERAIKLLQERRTALISAAVTGKIDVRKVAL